MPNYDLRLINGHKKIITAKNVKAAVAKAVKEYGSRKKLMSIRRIDKTGREHEGLYF